METYRLSFMLEKTEFMGLIFGRRGIKVNTEKAAVVQEWSAPKPRTELQGFIGLIQFSRRLIKGFSSRAS